MSIGLGDLAVVSLLIPFLFIDSFFPITTRTVMLHHIKGESS